MSERRPIPRWEGLYEASSDGRIWSVTRLVRCRGGHRSVNAREMVPTSISGGYLQVQLSIGGKHYHKLIHRLVCEAFHGAPADDAMQVNHKNGVRDDNRPENLEWVTCAQNARHGWQVLGRQAPRPMLGRFGALHNRAVAVEAVDPATGAVVHQFPSGMDAMRAGFNNSAITACMKGRRKSHAGFVWRATDGALLAGATKRVPHDA